MSDDNSAAIVIPEELKEKYSELIELVIGSESMNDEERQYWVNILPIMTPDQVDNLRQILQNERDQLNAIDKKYEKEITNAEGGKDLKKFKEERDKKRKERREKEGGFEDKERAKEEEILKAIADLNA